ncbi:P-loop containing nucleoside triphosphate hydrolase protein [Fragilariopsis cylindrus CCMP1102]|uniref:p-loop containing nucleoside triphosphate hydrolase protein n=1 Tax=Fragilariopsis cylindrus CCMP1102 TaxID=635003 RepID=A0A1E7FUP9_9STRA|nr:P-loop containing nucleoside triphosphate hydrolase protein [Fragilariopsis cylindrus CCMP1102]|eukprot:OEU21879.1 P-loop containing nucleoside triphosphate hydrolase protein [Fragilariopsis cylindrus CCMP1102]
MNIALIGPPGSGKGSYGKYFAKALQIPIFTVSDLLKKFRPDINISSGKLIDDTIVKEESDETTSITTGCWPEKYQIQSAIHLNVPDCVCKTKILGRRQCSKCGKSYNIANVNWNGWIMPSNIPSSQEEDMGHVCCVGNSDDNKNNNASTSCDWSIRRDDDTSDIIERRLEVYHHNSDPILEYFKNKKTRTTQSKGNSNSNSLLTLTPYHGFDDLPILVDKIHTWIGS